ncbi:MAG: IS110 family transposase [Selenomonadaceae bacterium]|nr:IS110 family transposase [Selenomonadaceae bacterium]
MFFAGLSPSTYQSGKFTSQNAVMEKRGSRYLRCALFLAARLVSRYSKTFAAYLKKKRDEGKHYFVALSHVAKKLVRIIFHLQKTGEPFLDFA